MKEIISKLIKKHKTRNPYDLTMIYGFHEELIQLRIDQDVMVQDGSR